MEDNNKINYKKLILVIIGVVIIVLETSTFIKMYKLLDKDEKSTLIMPIIICILTFLSLLIMMTQEEKRIYKIIGILSSWIPCLTIPIFIDMTLTKMIFSTIFLANIIPFMSFGIGVIFTTYFATKKPINIKAFKIYKENLNNNSRKYRYLKVIIIILIVGILIFDRIMVMRKINDLSSLQALERNTVQDYIPQLESNKENIVENDNEKINDSDVKNDLKNNPIEKAKQLIIDKYEYDYGYIVLASEGTYPNLDGVYYIFGFDVAGTGAASGEMRLLVEQNTFEIYEAYSDGFICKNRYKDNEQIIFNNNVSQKKVVTFSSEEAFNLVGPGFAGNGFSLDEHSVELVTIDGRECWRFAQISHKTGEINSYVFFDIYTGEYNTGNELSTPPNGWSSKYY